jgi:putative heme iron utilization protein
MAASCASASWTGVRLGSRAPARARPATGTAPARPVVSRGARAQAANPGGHNHRPSSPTRTKPSGGPRPGSPMHNARAVETPATARAGTATGGRTSSGVSNESGTLSGAAKPLSSAAGAGTPATPSAREGPTGASSVSRRNKRSALKASTNAGFQRTSWYGAVSEATPVKSKGSIDRSTFRLAATPDAGSGPGPGGGGVVVNPAVVKQGSGSNPAGGADASLKSAQNSGAAKKDASPNSTNAKPFAEPPKPSGELSLPRQSADAKETFNSREEGKSGRKGALTRLLRTPLSGGVLNSMKDADLPSVAVAARNLMELADYADLSTIMSNMNHRRSGYPFASTVDFATDNDGYPVFCLTPLAMHTRNLAYNSRASLTVKMNGWGGLANARVTIFGDVHRLPAEYQASANEIFKAKYAARKEASDLEDRWGDYTFYRMNNVIDVYFVGGFGTLNWVDLKEYRDAVPDKIVTPGAGHSVLDTLSELNTEYGAKLAKSGAVLGNSIAPNEAAGDFDAVRVDDLWIISIDKRGIDVRVRLDGVSQVRRINFMGCVETFQDACEALDAIVAGKVWEGGNCEEP